MLQLIPLQFLIGSASPSLTSLLRLRVQVLSGLVPHPNQLRTSINLLSLFLLFLGHYKQLRCELSSCYIEVCLTTNILSHVWLQLPLKLQNSLALVSPLLKCTHLNNNDIAELVVPLEQPDRFLVFYYTRDTTTQVQAAKDKFTSIVLYEPLDLLANI